MVTGFQLHGFILKQNSWFIDELDYPSLKEMEKKSSSDRSMWEIYLGVTWMKSLSSNEEAELS